LLFVLFNLDWSGHHGDILGAEAEEAQGQEEAGGGQEDRVKGCRSPTEIQGEEEKESEGDRKYVFCLYGLL